MAKKTKKILKDEYEIGKPAHGSDNEIALRILEEELVAGEEE